MCFTLSYELLLAQLISKRDSRTVIVFACHAAGPGSNLGEYLVLFSTMGR